jgi:hypothetical protein
MRRIVLAGLTAAFLSASFVWAFAGGGRPPTGTSQIRALGSLDAALAWRAEVERLSPRFLDIDSAREVGYYDFGDDIYSQWHHVVNWEYIVDDIIMDPEYPEALLYRAEPDGSRTLQAYVFVLPPRFTFANTPLFAEGLGEWHLHKNVCIAGDPWKDPADGVVIPSDLDTVAANCLPNIPMPLVLMTHAWVVPNICGPFSAAVESQPGLTNPRAAGTDRNGQVPGCTPELALRVWPSLYDTTSSTGELSGE